MNIGVVGSRAFNDYRLMDLYLSILFSDIITKIISGGAKGADNLAENYAKEKGVLSEVILPDWNKHGKAAGMIRNTEIVKKSDIIVAFWDGESRGTKDTIDKARKAKKPTFIVYF